MSTDVMSKRTARTLKRGVEGLRTTGDGTDHVTASSRRVRDEAGASLVLALLFLVVIGMIVGGIATWTSNGLSNTVVFQKSNAIQASLSSATNVAISSIRYTPLIGANQTLNASPPSYCWGTTSPSQLTTQGIPVDVWCSTSWDPTNSVSPKVTRTVTVSACAVSVTSDAGTCANNAGLQTTVQFDDYSADSPSISSLACQPPSNGGTCGAGMTILSSLHAAAVPTVSGISSSGGSVIPSNNPGPNGTSLTVTGTGFVQGATQVSFVATGATANPLLNLFLTGTGVTVASPTSLSVTIPPSTAVTPYWVVVTTSSGSSPTGSQCGCQYTYHQDVPNVTSVTTTSGVATGSAAGGTGLIIQGSGFLSQAAGDLTQVLFVDTANAAITYLAPANTVSVNATGTQVTAATPAIAVTDFTYYVEVQTFPGGTSTQRPTFTFVSFIPEVGGIFNTATNVASGGPNATVTITGVGFVASAGVTTVQLIPTTGNGTLAATINSVTNATTLTATIPTTGTVNRQYYVQVTTTTGGASGTNGAPIFTYT